MKEIKTSARVLISTLLFACSSTKAATIDFDAEWNGQSSTLKATFEQAVLDAGDDGTINLGSQYSTYEKSASAPILVTRAVTIAGQGKGLTVFQTYAGVTDRSIFKIQSDNVTFKNLTINGKVQNGETVIRDPLGVTSNATLMNPVVLTVPAIKVDKRATDLERNHGNLRLESVEFLNSCVINNYRAVEQFYAENCDFHNFGNQEISYEIGGKVLEMEARGGIHFISLGGPAGDDLYQYNYGFQVLNCNFYAGENTTFMRGMVIIDYGNLENTDDRRFDLTYVYDENGITKKKRSLIQGCTSHDNLIKWAIGITRSLNVDIIDNTLHSGNSVYQPYHQVLHTEDGTRHMLVKDNTMHCLNIVPDPCLGGVDENFNLMIVLDHGTEIHYPAFIVGVFFLLLKLGVRPPVHWLGFVVG